MDLNLAQNSEQVSTPQQSTQVKITDVKVIDENVALNLLVSFLSLAQKRGTFTLDESAKIWECISVFSKSGAK